MLKKIRINIHTQKTSEGFLFLSVSRSHFVFSRLDWEALRGHHDRGESLDRQARHEDQAALDHARVATDRVLLLVALRAVAVHLTTAVGVAIAIGVRPNRVRRLRIGIREDEVAILVVLHGQGQQELRNGEEAPNGRDLILMVRQRTAGERAREEEEERVLPHSQCKGREKESKEVERKSRSEIVLITVLQRHLPGKVGMAVERACLHSAHALNALGAHVVTSRHPHAIAHHDTGEHAHRQDKGQVALLGLVHERAEVQVGEERLEGEVEEAEQRQHLVHRMIALLNPDVLQRLQCLHGSKVRHTYPAAHWPLLPHVAEGPQHGGKRHTDRLREAHTVLFFSFSFFSLRATERAAAAQSA